MIDEVRRRARTHFADAAPAHDWHHVERVEALAETLADGHPRSVDREVLTLAVSLHDVGREREDRGEIDDHAVWGAEEAGRILRDLDADPETIGRVQHCIRAHRYSNDVEPETLEAELLCDADNLDALGAVGLARVFAHGGAIGSPIHDPTGRIAADDTRRGTTQDRTKATQDRPEATRSQSGASQIDHVHAKILDLPGRMYTDAARELADERAAFVRRFLGQFAAETAGSR